MPRGSQFVEQAELESIPLPQATKTYTPLSHFALSNSIKTISQDVLSDYQLVKERYEIARNGNQLFSVLTFNASQGDMGLSIGYRNSLDKSMSVGLCIGSEVFVCSNMMFTAQGGGIVVMKKHSKNLLNGLEDLTITTLYKAQYTFNQLIRDSEQLRAKGINDDEAFKMLGLLFGHGLLTPRQVPVVHKEWVIPSHKEFEPRTAWSFYQACTEAMKQNAPSNTMERSINLHKSVTGEWL